MSGAWGTDIIIANNARSEAKKYVRYRVNNVLVSQQHQTAHNLLPQLRLQLVVMRSDQAGQLRRESLCDIRVAGCDMSNEVNVFAQVCNTARVAG